jgi:hypothetical protein
MLIGTVLSLQVTDGNYISMRKISVEDFIRRADEVHSGKYDYSKVESLNGQDTILTIVCPDHGEFKKSVRLHLRGNGCPHCSNISRGRKISEIRNLQETPERRQWRWNKEFKNFLEKARKIHGDSYDYSQAIYQGNAVPIKILCPIHGLFMQKPVLHLQGRGCRQCKIDKRRLGVGGFIKRARKVHGDKYDYSLVTDYKNNQSMVTIVCPEHGEFEQAVHAHLIGIGCPQCGNRQKGMNQRFTTEDFIKRAIKVHNGKYDYSQVNYTTTMTPVTILCPDHGAFSQNPYQHLAGRGCPKCVHMISKGEIEIGDWLESFGFIVKRNVRGIVSNKSELDIYLPENNLAIEYNGLYWHSTRITRSHRRHIDKLETCESQGIRLIQFWDVEWEKKKDICKEIILFALGKIGRRIYARNCIIKEVSTSESNIFLDLNHIQGACKANFRLGLYYQDELIGVQCYSAPNTGSAGRDSWLVTRTCFSKGTQVIGGISKMFSHFIKTVHPDKVTDFTDRRLFVASGHSKMGFVRQGVSDPCNYLTDGDALYSRRHYRHWGKRHFKYKMPWDDALTDTENLANNGWYWVWDCGKIKNVWKRDQDAPP